ncbi:MAG: flagellar assembly protein FliW [Spirochaetes bacterium]|nr:MAG: flagellar assembly protein FliW [Spirochaetota bacterium]
MKIKTKPYGEIEVSERQRIIFPEGIIGFENIHQYFLIDSREGPFYWLQAEEEPDLAFLLVNPRIFIENYKLMVDKEDIKSIGVEHKKEMLDFAIVTVPEDPAKISANLMGPIIINKKTRVGKQVISKNNNYTVKHYILEEMKKTKEKLVESR